MPPSASGISIETVNGLNDPRGGLSSLLEIQASYLGVKISPVCDEGEAGENDMVYHSICDKQSLHFRPWKIFHQGEILLTSKVCFQSKYFVQT